MRPFSVSVCLLVLFLCGSTLHAQTPDGSPLADTPWPTYGQNLQRTGLSPLTGPDDPVAEWSYRRAGSSSVNGSAAMGPDSTLYIGMGNALVAVNPNGTEKWSYETELTIWSSPAVAEDGTIYIGDGTSNTLSSSGSLYALNADGTLKWRFQIEGTGAVSSPPAIGPDGTIYAGSYDDTLYAINPDGSLRWSFSVDGDIVGAPVLSNDGHLYVGTRTGTLYALMTSGEQLWTFDTGSSIIYTPALTADGILYVAAGGSLIAVGTDGEVRWTFSAPSSLTSPALGPGGDIYVGSGSYLLAVSPEGEQQWSFQLSDNAYGDPAVDADGTVFIPTFDRYVFAVNPDGTEQWRLNRGYSPYTNTSSPIVGPNDRIYIGATQYAYQYPDGYTYFESLFAIAQKPPEPVLSVTPEGTIDYGDVPLGESATQYITIANTGDAVLTVDDLYMYTQGSSNDYSPDTEVPFTVEPGASREVGIVLTPTEPSTRSAQLNVRSDGGSAHLRLIANQSPPIANNDTASTAIDTPLEVPMMENDYYGGYTSPEIVTPPASGTAEIGYAERSENPVFIEYTPSQGFEGRDTLQYRLSNSDGTSEPATVYVTVGSPNSPPSAQADTAETVENTPVTVDVLANDNDPDGDPLQITATSGTELGGSVTVSEDGQSLTYTPPEGASGTDYFSYRISDPDAATDDATVTITITAVNDAPVAVNDTVATDEDQQIGYLNVLANDSDPDDDPLTLTYVSAPNNGAASIIDNGIRYTPDADFSGDDAFTYTASDGNGATDTATVVVTVRPVNDAPVFTSEPPTEARQGDAYIYEVQATDVDDEELALTLPAHPSWLQLEDNGDGTGTLRGTPGPQDAGSFDVVLEASDTDASTQQAFSITVEGVNDAPVAVNDTVTTDEDQQIGYLNVLANDTDPDGDPLTVTDVGVPSGGSASVIDNGIRYTPDADFFGDDSFTYTVSDTSGAASEAIVVVTVRPVNDAPVAVDDTVGTSESTSVIVNALTNDEDPDGDALQITATSDTEFGGTVTISDDGQSLTYTPPEGASGTDYFSYRISDPDAATDDATVTVIITDVNDAPVAVNDTVATDEDQQIGYLNVLANDSDPDDDPLTLTNVGDPDNGTASIIDNGIRYTPDTDFFGEDTFTYTAGDGNGAAGEATVVVTVMPVNDAPVFASEPVTQAQQGEAYTYAVRATDVDDQELALTLSTHPEWLQLADNGDGTGTLRGTPGPQDAGSFDVVIEAADAESNTQQSFSITVEDINDAPVAANDTAATDEDTPVSVDVLANDSSPSGSELDIAAVLEPAAGTAEIREGHVHYASSRDFSGRDSLRYAVENGSGLRDTAWVFIAVRPVNDAPVARGDTISTQVRTPVLVDVLANDDDVDDDVLIVAADGSTEHNGTVSVTEDSRIRYTPPAGFQGTDRFTYTVRDAAEASDQGQVVIRVQAVNFTITDLGTLDGGSVSAAFGVNDAGDVIGTATDTNGELTPFIWRDGSMQALSVPQAVEAQALAINKDGTIVGLARRSDSTSHAFRLSADGRAEMLGTLGGTFSAAYAINDSGSVAGTATLPDDRTFRAFRWTENGMDGLSIPSAEHSQGFAINNASLVAGTAQLASGIRRAFVGTELLEDGDESRAYGLNSSAWLVGSIRQGDAVVPYLWRPGGDPLPLPVLAGSFGEAYAVNDAGWIVGTSSTADDPSERLMARWLSGPATSFRHTRSVLTLGQAAGKAAAPETRAALWIDGQLYDLNTLVSEGAEWRLDEARSINSRGQIVGYGRRSGERRAFLLTPTDNAPPTAQNDVISETGGSGPLTLDVLANDSDVDGDALALVGVSAPRHGTAVIAEGRITYRPSAGHSRDEFTYTISDGRGSTATASVMLRLDAGATPLTELVLRSNYPNPFQTETVIEYTLPQQGPVRLEVFNMLGQRVAVLVDGVQEAGPKRRAFQPAASLPDGTYFYRLHWNGQARTRSFTLIR